MPQPRPSYTYKLPVEVDAKAVVSETIRTVRVILKRSKPPETSTSATSLSTEADPTHPIQCEPPD